MCSQVPLHLNPLLRLHLSFVPPINLPLHRMPPTNTHFTQGIRRLFGNLLNFPRPPQLGIPADHNKAEVGATTPRLPFFFVLCRMLCGVPFQSHFAILETRPWRVGVSAVVASPVRLDTVATRLY